MAVRTVNRREPCGGASAFGLSLLLLEEARYPFGRPGTLRHPVTGALLIDLQADLGTGRNGVEEANTFHIPAVTPIPAVGHHDMVEGPLLGAAPCQSNAYHKSLNP